MLGHPVEEIAGGSAFALVHPEDRTRFEAAFADCLVAPGRVTRGEYRMRHRDGSWRVIEGVGVNRLAEPAVRAAVVTLRDVTDRRQAEAALRASEQRYALAARGTNDGLWDWDLAANRVFYSPRWKAMLGHDEAAIGDSPDEWLTRVHAKDLAPLRAAIDAHLAGRTPHFEFEYRILHREGTYLWAVARGLALRDATGAPVRIAGSQTDVSDRKQAEPVGEHVLQCCRGLQPRHKRPPEYESWLAPAPLLRDTGKFINHKGHHRHTQYIISSTEIYGFTLLQRTMISAVARYLGKSRPQLGDRALRNIPPEEHKNIDRAIVLLRLAVALNQDRASDVLRVSAKIYPKRVYLEVRQGRPGAELELWSLRKEADYFREVFGRELFATLA